jgi:hypothetical protein
MACYHLPRFLELDILLLKGGKTIYASDEITIIRSLMALG